MKSNRSRIEEKKQRDIREKVKVDKALIGPDSYHEIDRMYKSYLFKAQKKPNPTKTIYLGEEVISSIKGTSKSVSFGDGDPSANIKEIDGYKLSRRARVKFTQDLGKFSSVRRKRQTEYDYFDQRMDKGKMEGSMKNDIYHWLKINTKHKNLKKKLRSYLIHLVNKKENSVLIDRQIRKYINMGGRRASSFDLGRLTNLKRSPQNFMFEDLRVSLRYEDIDIVKEKTLKQTRKLLPKSAFKTLRVKNYKDSPLYQIILDEMKAKEKAQEEAKLKSMHSLSHLHLPQFFTKILAFNQFSSKMVFFVDIALNFLKKTF